MSYFYTNFFLSSEVYMLHRSPLSPTSTTLLQLSVKRRCRCHVRAVAAALRAFVDRRTAAAGDHVAAIRLQ
jgi:hypothetical protein